LAGEEQHFHHVGHRSVFALLPDFLRMKLDSCNFIEGKLAAGACKTCVGTVRFVACHGTAANAVISAGAAIGTAAASEADAIKDVTLICIMRTYAYGATLAWNKMFNLHSICPMLLKSDTATHRGATLRVCPVVSKYIKNGVQVAGHQPRCQLFLCFAVALPRFLQCYSVI
jgi:hypothetical protein